MFVSKRKLNKKLDLIMVRQNFLAECIFCQFYTLERTKQMKRKWNKIWYDIMENNDGKRG